ncbi:MAG: DUF2974 domain-containing protein [Eubacteriales bacterium]|nr:DUF2974 domain-containing protein [Eubacteriales bacterium]MDD3883033.1 DUF2974 domain-containing protein [Eubacteriales bacterium]MDD4513640.1 DUF2974 domain-containing protein [Eubacteriales bacterium]
MANIIDYLAWRGDIGFDETAVCDVDMLIFSRLSYLPMDGIVPADFGACVPFGDAVKAVLQKCENGEAEPRMREDSELMKSITTSARFSSLKACGFVSRLDSEREMQFAAITFLLPDGSSVIAFRGTDGTLTGWKEDFNMSFSETIPSQIDAADYFTRLCAERAGGVRLCGHSKGGNLAVYAASFCDEKIQDRVICARSFDGPGFSDSLTEKEGYKRMLPKLKTFMPRSSIIGMMLEHDEDFTIVESQNISIFQHNIYYWQLLRGEFMTVPGFTNSSQLVDKTTKLWVSEMSPELREKFINGLYDVASASGAKTVRELLSGKNVFALMKALAKLDPETRGAITKCVGLLKNAAKDTLPELAGDIALPQPRTPFGRK